MKNIKYKDWELIVEEKTTKDAYDKTAYGSPENCGCNECKNFIHNRKAIYPEEVQTLFIELGIDYKKEAELTHYCRMENGLHYYGGWFHFKGKFVGKNCIVTEKKKEPRIELTSLTEHFSIGFHYGNEMAIFKGNDKETLVQIDFTVKTPWSINKKLESE